MKKILSLLSVMILFFTSVTFGQTTVSIPDTTLAENTEVLIPVKADASLEDVGSLTLNISYDKNVLEYKSIENNLFNQGTFLAQDNDGVISIAWFSTTSVDVTDKLFDLKFQYKTGNSALEFTGVNEITDVSAPPVKFDITFQNGSVGAKGAELKLGDVTGKKDEIVTVPFTATNLEKVGSMTFYIDYDNTKLEYVGVQNDAVGFQANAANSQVILAWATVDTTTFSMNTGTLVDLQFKVLGGNSDLTFASQTEITDIDGNSITAITLINGKVTEDVPPPVVTSFVLPTVEGFADNEVVVPVQALKISDLAAFTMDITYDTSVLEFVRFEDVVAGTFTANEVSGKLNMGWYDTTPFTHDDTTFVKLVFNYKGGMTNLTLNATEIKDIDNNDLTVQLVNGMVKEFVVDTKIMDIQKPAESDTTGDSPLKGQIVSTRGIVTAVYVKNDAQVGYFIQDAEGAWNGVYVYDKVNMVTVGDDVTLRAEVDEFYNLTELKNIEVFHLNSTGNTLYNAVDISAADFNTEAYEGVLVYVDSLATVTEANKYGEATLNDGTADLMTDDMLYSFAPVMGETYDITGVGYYSFGNFKLLPLDAGSVTDVDENSSVVPNSFVLEQNYPNPFNPSTKIQFSLKVDSKVSLKVFNVLGQEVANLVNANMAAGTQIVNFNASNLASGMYLYRLEVTGNDGSHFVDVKKMTLMK